MDTDRSLLFGVLAMQADLITPDQFVQACTLWTTRKDTSLADLLMEQGWLTAADRTAVDRLLERKLKKHHGDARASLAEVASNHVQHLLAVLDDADVQRSLDQLSRQDGQLLLTTAASLPETRERYTLTRLHARGGIGRVWLARDSSLGREVALKELQPDRIDEPAFWSRFLKEAQITGQLEHPGIVPVYELSRQPENRQPFYTMRFVKGRTLTEAVQAYHKKRKAGQAGPLDLSGLLNAFVGVCQAVGYAHSRGVIHRDLKGQNVVLGDYGEVIVLDWGLAKLVDRPEDDTAALSVVLNVEGKADETVQGQVLGTPAYMAPEQAEGRLDQIDRRTDVYGLGAMLYEILTGQPPFTGTDTLDVLRKVCEEEPLAPRAVCLGVPAPLEAVCLRALAKKPGARYATAREIAQEVKCWLAGEPVTVYREPWTHRMARWAKRHKPLMTGLGALLLTAVLSLTVHTVRISRAQEETNRARAEAEANFHKASHEKARADQRAEDFRKQLYISNVNRALGEWQNNNVSLAERLLNGCPEDLRGWEWRYARRLCYQERLTIHGCFALGMQWYGDAAHYTVAFSPDSQWVATMDWDHTIKLWDTATGTRVRAMQGDTGLVYSLAFSPDGKRLASGNTDHTVRIWNTETGELLHTLRGHHSLVYLVHFSTDGERILSASPVFVDNHLWLSQMEVINWDASTGGELSRKVVADANIRWGGVAFSPDGSHFIASGNNEARDVGPSIVGYRVRPWDTDRFWPLPH